MLFKKIKEIFRRVFFCKKCSIPFIHSLVIRHQIQMQSNFLLILEWRLLYFSWIVSLPWHKRVLSPCYSKVLGLTTHTDRQTTCKTSKVSRKDFSSNHLAPVFSPLLFQEIDSQTLSILISQVLTLVISLALLLLLLVLLLYWVSHRKGKYKYSSLFSRSSCKLDLYLSLINRSWQIKEGISMKCSSFLWFFLVDLFSFRSVSCTSLLQTFLHSCLVRLKSPTSSSLTKQRERSLIFDIQVNLSERVRVTSKQTLRWLEMPVQLPFQLYWECIWCHTSCFCDFFLPLLLLETTSQSLSWWLLTLSWLQTASLTEPTSKLQSR